MQKTFGKLIQTRREARGIKSADLAVRIGVSPSTLSEMENDRKRHAPDPDVLAGLERELDLSQPEMLTALGYACGPPVEASAEPFPADDPRAQVIAWLRVFDDRDAHAMVLIAEALHTAANAERGDLTYKRKTMAGLSS